MSKITLDVEKKDIDTVLTILNNLKSGLVKNITVDNRKVNTNQINKAVSKPQKKPILEDEFMSSTPTNSKYLSPNAFKNRLNKTQK